MYDKFLLSGTSISGVGSEMGVEVGSGNDFFRIVISLNQQRAKKQVLGNLILQLSP